MAARVATSAAKRRFPMLPSLCGQRVRSSNCFLGPRIGTLTQHASREWESRKVGPTRIYGAAPKSLQPDLNYKPSWKKLVPLGNEAIGPCVSETKHTSSYGLSDILTADHLFPNSKLKPKPYIYILYPDEHKCIYFSAHSVEEDGTISSSPKYYIYPPSPLRETCFFTGKSCNGLFHFQNQQYDDFLWNPTTNEFKALPNSSFDHQHPRGVRVTNYKIGCGMWSDNRCADNYKLLQLVLADTEDVEEESSIDLSYHIHLYSLKTNSWKKIPCSEFVFLDGPGVTINEVYYAPGYLIEKEEIGVLLSFNFSTETLSSLPRPPIQKGLSCAYYLEYKGLFGYLACWTAENVPLKNKVPVRFELWVMKNRSWTMESVFHTCGVSKPLWFSRNGELLYFASLNDEVLVFDRATGKLNHPGINFCWFGTKLTPFVESFVQLNGISHAEAEELEKEEEEGYMIEANEGPLMQV